MDQATNVNRLFGKAMHKAVSGWLTGDENPFGILRVSWPPKGNPNAPMRFLEIGNVMLLKFMEVWKASGLECIVSESKMINFSNNVIKIPDIVGYKNGVHYILDIKVSDRPVDVEEKVGQLLLGANAMREVLDHTTFKGVIVNFVISTLSVMWHEVDLDEAAIDAEVAHQANKDPMRKLAGLMEVASGA